MGTNFLQVHYSPINLFYSEIGIIKFGALKLNICSKQPGLLYFQNRTRICSKIELHFDEFLGPMGSKFEYTYFKDICSPRNKFTQKFESLNWDETQLMT